MGDSQFRVEMSLAINLTVWVFPYLKMWNEKKDNVPLIWVVWALLRFYVPLEFSELQLVLRNDEMSIGIFVNSIFFFFCLTDTEDWISASF